MEYCLILIDVQKKFKAANDPVFIENVKKEVLQAISKDATVLSVEYQGHGKLHSEIGSLIKDYANFYVVKKSGDDGAIDILDKLFQLKIKPKILRIAGVNISHCVRSTVETLSKLYKYKIIVAGAACNCIYKKSFFWTKPLKNVSILKSRVTA